jgi:hypothetical protein
MGYYYKGKALWSSLFIFLPLDPRGQMSDRRAMYAWWSWPYGIVSRVGHLRLDLIELFSDDHYFAHISALVLYQRSF